MMSTRPIKGSGGPATPSIWMSTLADKFTMNRNFIGPSRLFSPTNTATRACLFANQYNLVNASFTTFVTAPDGTTNTAQRITEDTSATTNHGIMAGIVGGPIFSTPNCRMAGIFKADTRTRIAFCVTADSLNGYFVGFDLAGGQIAYGQQTFGNPIAAGVVINILNQQIISLGSGFYLCILDYNDLHVISSCTFQQVFIDAGSGTGAANISYTGNGSSSVIGWKMSTLPVDAWHINNTVFFDGFDDPTLANFDLNNTFADGFDYYLTAFCPGFFQPVPLPKANLSASSSVLTILPVTPGGGQGNAAVYSWGNPGDGRAHGAKGRNVHAPPVLFEFKYKLPFLLQPDTASSEIAFFPATVEFFDNLSQAAVISGPVPYSSVDATRVNHNICGWEPTLFDNGQTSGVGYTYNLTVDTFTQLTGTYTSTTSYATGIGSPNQTVGFAQWTSSHGASNTAYNPNAVIFHIPDSTFYYANTGGVLGEPPNANWNTFTYPANASINNQPAVFTDLTLFHIFTYIILPYNRLTQAPGSIILFFDGQFVGLQTWSPVGNGDQVIHTVDWQQFFLMLQTGQRTGSGYGPSYDYVKVMR